jgi:peroxiredoxin
MDTNHEADVNRWADDRMARLDPEIAWQPNVARALARFEERRRSEQGRGWTWTWIAAATVAACVCLLVFPASRQVTRYLSRDRYHQMVNIGQVSAAGIALRQGQTAPDFTLQSASGDNIQLSAYKGDVVPLNFWATWCDGCKREVPWLTEFENKYGAKGLAVMGVSMDDDGWKSVRPFITEKKVNYPVVIGNDDMAKPYGLSQVSAMPMTFLIDRKGKIAAISVGVVDKDACEHEIVQLLAK